MRIHNKTLGGGVGATSSTWRAPALMTLAILATVLGATGCDSSNGTVSPTEADSRSDDSDSNGPDSHGEHRGMDEMHGDDPR